MILPDAVVAWMRVKGVTRASWHADGTVAELELAPYAPAETTRPVETEDGTMVSAKEFFSSVPRLVKVKRDG